VTGLGSKLNSDWPRVWMKGTRATRRMKSRQCSGRKPELFIHDVEIITFKINDRCRRHGCRDLMQQKWRAAVLAFKSRVVR
jgi:hypothetical protein